MIRPLMFLLGVMLLGCLSTVQAQDQPKIDPEIDKLIKALRDKSVEVSSKLRALKLLREKGETAADAATAICDAMLDRSLQVAKAALETLEKVRPDLYTHVSVLVLDQDYGKRLKAIRELGLLGERALPVTNLLLARLRSELAKDDYSQFASAYFSALRQIKPDSEETIKLYKTIASSTSYRDGYYGKSPRLEAIEFLVEWAGEETSRRKQLLPLLKSALNDRRCVIPCIRIIGDYGDLAKDFIPILKKFKFSSDEEVRKAAGEALDKLENR
ncbi:MAG: hypothetical protein RMJ56_02905 [Gemmataceae bacterium]|nr:hypothetical protein [Gemmata sp.]MDW8196536.1 hypothetical protein [Gemmataceae bacterium]